DFKWVLKQELRNIPGLGIGCEKVGHIFIDRADPQHALSALKAAQSTVINGTSVVFFPEGTRGTAGKMGDFKKGAFRFALETGLPLLPITLTNTGTLLPPHTVNLRPGRATMIIHQKIEVTGYTPQHLDELMHRAKTTILAGLEKDS
ncbi:MAG TPA: lysophospholipid acyltransferase family protein, partial [Candidatus Competibacteraceae bacterium]|nr:lysophospholipid acyltransferase family protein [Candidatus Competibacteraceae bacterium]